MFVGTNKLTISLALAASLLLSSITAAQSTTSPTSDWSRLTAIAAGSKLAIRLKGGKTVEGKLQSVSDTALTLTVKNKPVDVGRGEVLTVHQIRGKSSTAATLTGMGIGAGAGAALGAAGGCGNCFFLSRGELAGILGVAGAGVGALTGHLIGRRSRKRVLIYEASQP